MPISFNEVASVGDPLPNNRHVLRFPDISAAKITGNDLTLRHTVVALPPLNVGQIIVPQLGWNMAFAGLRMQENTFTAEFVETVNAPVIKALARWQDLCSGFKTHLSRMKQDYAVVCECKAYDTVGETAMTVWLYNVWPMTIVYGQFSEDSVAAHVQVTFSVDCIDLRDITPADEDFERSIPTASPQPQLWYNSSSGASFNSGSSSNFNISNSISKSLSGVGDVSTLLGKYF